MMKYKDEGSGIPIVLLHGYCGSHLYWTDILPLLTSQYRVITPDLPGHGDSTANHDNYTMEYMAEQTVEMLNEIGLEKVYLFGHSLGGYVTLAVAERYPERLYGMGLLHSTSFADSDVAKDNRLKAVSAIEQNGIAAFVDGLIPKLFAPEHRQTMEPLLNRAKEIGYGTTSQSAIGCALGMRERIDRTTVLNTLELPILLLAGALDEVIAEPGRFPVSRSNITPITLEKVAHMGMMEAPNAFANAILAFLERNR